MKVLRNIGTLAACRAEGPPDEVYGIPDAALAWEGATIQWVGRERDLPLEFRGWPSEDAGGRLVVPGLVDCHTHLAFGGWRAGEFEQRIRGATYLEIAGSGGGIASTVRSTRDTPSSALADRCRDHLAGMARLGITTVEAKSGYGLTPDEELRLLRVYAALSGGPQRIVPTLLAAHTIPPEYQGRRGSWVAVIIEEIIPRVAAEGLARFCDAFVETSAFTVAEGRQVLEAGKRHGLRPKLHADQLSAGGGAELASEVGAVSADHLERVSTAGIRAMAGAGVVAVSLPFASLYLDMKPLPARELIEAGVPVAVATDFNPGSAPSWHLPMAMTLACLTQRMTPGEVLRGATIVAARAVGLDGEIGSLEAGKAADFAVIDADSVAEWLYHLRPNACVRTVARGVDI
jgi:imidazolonepropionase